MPRSAAQLGLCPECGANGSAPCTNLQRRRGEPRSHPHETRPRSRPLRGKLKADALQAKLIERGISVHGS